MNPSILSRKGSRKLQDIPQEVLSLLNQGAIPTVNLTEWLAIDHAQLITTNFPAMGIANAFTQQIVEQIGLQKKPTTMNSVKLIGSMLYDHYQGKPGRDEVFQQLSKHQSDTIRCYAPYMIALDKNIAVEEKLKRSMPLIADQHFGIREVVWMALRVSIEANLHEAIAYMTPWATHHDENIRRFTTEATRPRGVWCKHIDRLKEEPQLALPLLNSLKADPAKYVQDSVGNWLNDASKTQPQFVIDLCQQWQADSPTKDTAKIIKRALRTIESKK